MSAERYEVGAEVVAAVEQSFPEPGDLIQYRNGRPDFDLWAANRRALREHGVREIEVSELCPVPHRAVFFSQRGDRGQSARFGAVIALRNGST